METKNQVRANSAKNPGKTSTDILRESETNELFIALVGPAGAGAGTAASILEQFFQEEGYEVELIKASNLIKNISKKYGLELPQEETRKSIESIKIMQDRGDDLRRGQAFGKKEDHASVARIIVEEIRASRTRLQGKTAANENCHSEDPNGSKRAFIIDSLRHPAEVHLLRRVYQEAFCLVGILCDPDVREERIRTNFFDKREQEKDEIKRLVAEFLERDAKAPEKFGQQVAETFHEADYFVDNTKDADGDLQKHTAMNHPLKRLLSLVTHNKIVRPSIAETAMHHARSAQMRSACLSRQVGAALVDKHGNIVATGTNEAPKAGGGVYGNEFDPQIENDHRCAYGNRICSSNVEQNAIIDELIDAIPELSKVQDQDDLQNRIRGTRIGGLIEFSRAVHAEMDAILSASASGVSAKGCRLYVSTYPCHFCARHIIAAGIDEVQFIEPYPKSLASKLHADAITTDHRNWSPPSELPVNAMSADTTQAKDGPSNTEKKVLFRPFVGVSPRFYRRVFLKDRPYKDRKTGTMKIGQPSWGGQMTSYKDAYPILEKKLGDLSDG